MLDETKKIYTYYNFSMHRYFPFINFMKIEKKRQIDNAVTLNYVWDGEGAREKRTQTLQWRIFF